MSSYSWFILSQFSYSNLVLFYQPLSQLWLLGWGSRSTHLYILAYLKLLWARLFICECALEERAWTGSFHLCGNSWCHLFLVVPHQEVIKLKQVVFGVLVFHFQSSWGILLGFHGACQFLSLTLRSCSGNRAICSRGFGFATLCLLEHLQDLVWGFPRHWSGLITLCLGFHLFQLASCSEFSVPWSSARGSWCLHLVWIANWSSRFQIFGAPLLLSQGCLWANRIVLFVCQVNLVRWPLDRSVAWFVLPCWPALNPFALFGSLTSRWLPLLHPSASHFLPVPPPAGRLPLSSMKLDLGLQVAKPSLQLFLAQHLLFIHFSQPGAAYKLRLLLGVLRSFHVQFIIILWAPHSFWWGPQSG